MTWGNKTNYSTEYLDAGTDSPASARADIKSAMDELTNVIDGLNTAGGAAKLDSTSGKVIATSGIQSNNNDLALTPDDGYSVNISTVLNLAPQTVAELEALAAGEGDIAYCSNGDAGSKCIAVYDGTNWKVVALASTISAT